MERRCIRWRADSEKFVVAANCERRGWVRWDPADGDDWNFYWCVVGAHRDSLVWGSCVQGLGGGGGTAPIQRRLRAAWMGELGPRGKGLLEFLRVHT